MGLFNGKKDINTGVEEFRNTEGAVLVDVRDVNEFNAGHIPDAVNLPLAKIADTENEVVDKETPLYVYCLSGGRSARAVAFITQLGYKNVKNIGGIEAYKGELA